MPFLYLVPAFATGLMLGVLWLSDELSHPLAIAVCWLIGIALQFFVSRGLDVVWLAGLLINVVIGVYLAVRMKLT